MFLIPFRRATYFKLIKKYMALSWMQLEDGLDGMLPPLDRVAALRVYARFTGLLSSASFSALQEKFSLFICVNEPVHTFLLSNQS